MSFKDFCLHFDMISCCRLFNKNIIMDNSEVHFPDTKYKRAVIHGKWDLTNSGGMVTDEGFATNPRIILEVMVLGHILLTLSRPSLSMHADTRDYRTSIGFTIHKHGADYKKRPTDNSPDSIVQNPVNGRYNSLEVYLKPGTYIITPATRYPNRRTSFVFEAFSASTVQLMPADNFQGTQSWSDEPSTQQPTSGGLYNPLLAREYEIGSEFFSLIKDAMLKTPDPLGVLMLEAKVNLLVGLIRGFPVDQVALNEQKKGQTVMHLITSSGHPNKMAMAGKEFFALFDIESDLSSDEITLNEVGRSVVRLIKLICSTPTQLFEFGLFGHSFQRLGRTLLIHLYEGFALTSPRSDLSDDESDTLSSDDYSTF